MRYEKYDQKAMENLAIEMTRTNCEEYMAAYKMRLRYQEELQRYAKRKKRKKKTEDDRKRKLAEKLAKEKGLENEIRDGVARLIIGDTEEFLMELRKKAEKELIDAGWKL